MGAVSCGERPAGINVSELQIWEVGKNLFLTDTLGERFEDVRDANAQAADAGLAATLAGVEGDALLCDVVHRLDSSGS